MKKFFASLLIAFSIGGLLTVPAQADETQSALVLLDRVPAEKVIQNTDNANVRADLTPGSSLSVTASDLNGVEQHTPGIEISIDGVSSLIAVKPGLTAFKDGSSAEGLVEESTMGFRILREIHDSSDPAQFAYQTNLPEDAGLIPVADGFLIASESAVFGYLGSPWAVDAQRNYLPTSFTLADGLLTQQVIVPADASYPIVVDPNWAYSFTYSTRTSPNSNWIKLHNCFNCYFPISGAPQWWPAPNELLPLIANMQNMECRMGTVVVGGLQDYSWSFRATANHLDGYGSHITFSLRYVGGVPSLIVNAFIVNEPFVGRDLMLMFANSSWQTFATNLGYK